MSSEPNRSATADIPGARRQSDDGPGLLSAFTLVVWAACVVVGVTGLMSQPAAAPPPPPTSQPAVTVMDVELETDPAPPSPIRQAAAPPPPGAAAMQTPELPTVPTAAPPSPAIAFAVPVDGPARIGSAAAAVPVGRSAAPAVQRITYGQGVGRQPAPDYPDEARDAGQQGVVTVRLSVDADGRVTQAWAVAPSPFPLLNRAAVDAVRDRWRFAPGAPRLYDVSITFQLNPAE